MNIFCKKFLILGLVAAHLGAMELPHAVVPTDYMEASSAAIDSLPIAPSQWRIFEGIEPVAVASEEDVVHFEPVNSQTSGVALSENGFKRAVWLGAQNKIFINYPGDALNAGASFAEPQANPEQEDDLIDIHWVGEKLAFMSRAGITFFDPQSSATCMLLFDETYQLAAPMPGFKPSSFRCTDNELVFATYSEMITREYLYRIMYHSTGDIRTVCKLPMKRLFFYSIFAASEKFTAVIKEARSAGDSTRNPKIKLFTTTQLDALDEKDHGVTKVVPAITYTLPYMPVDAAAFSPDEKSLFIACMIDNVPSILVGLIGKTDISFVARHIAPAQVWNMFWPARAEGPYISHDPDENKSSQLVLAQAKALNKRKTGESEDSEKIQKLG